MQKNWTQNTPFPGSMRPVYGAQYPPLQMSGGVGGSPAKTDTKFRNYENSVSDVWDEGVTVDDDLALTSAAKVLELHAANTNNKLPTSSPRDDHNSIIMPNCNPAPLKNNKQQAMQRLATQKDPIPGSTASSPATMSSGGGIYPRLPEVSLASSNRRPLSANFSSSSAPSHPHSTTTATHHQQHHNHHNPQHHGHSPSNASVASILPKTAANKNGDVSRFDRLRRVLGVRRSGSADSLQTPAGDSSSAALFGSNAGGGGGPGTTTTTPPNEMVNLDELRRDCWLGIPHKVRPLAWRILSDYVPANPDRRETVLRKKREEYWHYVEQYFHTRYDEQHQVTFRQIHIDIPRMCPLIPLFQQKMVQEIFERILYIWAIRHPASGYVQGINDLVTPFFVVYLSEFIQDDVEVGTFDVAQLPRSSMEVVEADSFWCVSALLDTIQDNYTFAQPGIQRKVQDLRDLMSRVDRNLYQHFENHGVEFLQFAFRWMNNLLMREIPLRATIRLWDTYLSERQGFSQFHTYVCGAFLRIWSRQLQVEKDFQGIMLLLQNLPTQSWNDQQICELTADAYSLMQMFHGAKNHFQ